MSLDKYWKKRDFGKTPEPRGTSSKSSQQLSYFIQKHDARRLHYDFRLELAGKLLSWAVPKGPSLNPADKRLAVHVEDHPLSYGTFEGVIPPKQYGAGTVLLWDRGIWKPEGDPAKGYRQGRLKFRLQGEKLSGRWNLVRMGPPKTDKENWLLIKEQDEDARRGAAADITAQRPESVLKQGRKKIQAPEPSKGARKGAMPETMKPQLATLSEQPPPGDEWLSEVKLDGYRVLCRLQQGTAQLFTRSGLDWTHKWESIAQAASKLPVEQAWIDGELVAVDDSGAIRFQAMQNLTRGQGAPRLVYYVFDLVYMNGHDLSQVPLLERKELLRQIISTRSKSGPIVYNDHIAGRAADVFEHACLHGMEGIVAKRADAAYVQDRVKSWLKIKCRHRQEFVIGGFTKPAGSRAGFGALLVGVYDDQQKLRYAGRVGTGFDQDMLKTLAAKFALLEQTRSPFSNPPTGREAHGVRWLKPQFVAEVNFSEWTDSGVIRHAAFAGLREDKAAREVVREHAARQNLSSEKTERTSKKKSPASKAAAKPEKTTAAYHVAGVAISNATRVLFPEIGLTKLGLAQYYEQVAEWVLPHLHNRPLTLVRCPQGGAGKCFFQKHVTQSTTREIGRVKVPEDEGSAIYMMANNLPAIVSLVQMGVLELHTWGAQAGRLDKPDRLIFDLDPAPELPWAQVIEAALLMRTLLEEHDLRSFLKTTGGKGLHVVVPIQPERPWSEVKGFTRAIAEHLASALPERFTAKITKAKRTNKIFIDYLRNGSGATAVAAFSTRARPNAPLSVPIAWEELNKDLRSDSFTVSNIQQRLKAQRTDPWKDYFQIKQRLSAALLRKYSPEN